MKILRKDRTHHTKTLEKPGKSQEWPGEEQKNPRKIKRKTQKNRVSIISKTNLRKIIGKFD